MMIKKMKTKIFIMLIFVLSVFLITGCSQKTADNKATQEPGKSTQEPAKTAQEPAKEEPKKVYEFSVSHFFPATHNMEKIIMPGWAKAVSDATDGQVKLVSYPGNTLMPPGEAFDGVIKGVADIAISAHPYSRGRFPIAEAFMLPGLVWPNAKAMSLAINDAITNLYPDEMKGTTHLWSFATGPGNLYTKTPVKKMEDLKNLPVAVTSGPRVDAVKAMGGSATNLPAPELYENLQSGIVKGAFVSWETMQGFKLSEVTGDYVTEAPFMYGSTMYCVMNTQIFESMPQDLRDKFLKATKEYYEANIPQAFDENGKLGKKFHSEKRSKYQYIKLAPEEQARWLKVLDEKIIQPYVKVLDSKGLPGKEILDNVKKLNEKYSKLYPDSI